MVKKDRQALAIQFLINTFWPRLNIYLFTMCQSHLRPSLTRSLSAPLWELKLYLLLYNSVYLLRYVWRVLAVPLLLLSYAKFILIKNVLI